MNTSLGKLVEKTITLFVVLICIGIAVFDWFDLMDPDSPFHKLVSNLPNITLVLLSLLAGYMVFVQPEKDDSRHHDLTGLITSINPLRGKIEQLRDFDTCVNYIRHRISNANKRIICCYADPTLTFYQAVPEGISYREILAINSSNTQVFDSQRQSRLDTLKQRSPHHSSATYQLTEGMFLQFFVIDSFELILLSKLKSCNIAIVNPEIINYFQVLFESMTNEAKLLK